MSKKSTIFSTLVLLFVLNFGAGCSLAVDLGNNILSMVGITSGSTTESAGSKLLSAMRNLNREEEYYLGRAVAARILAIYQESEDPALIEYVGKVGQIVARSSSRPYTFNGYHFSVLKSDAVNAYAAPGGFVFITEGLLKILPDEDSLASVLAHEVAHVALRHGEKSISEKNMNDSLMLLGQIAGAISCSDILQQASVIFGSAVDDVVGQLLEKGYSREQEAQADAAGLEIIIASGYKSSSVLEVLALLRAGNANEEGGWFSSHPDLEKRVDKLTELSFKLKAPLGDMAAYEKRKLRFQKVAQF